MTDSSVPSRSDPVPQIPEEVVPFVPLACSWEYQRRQRVHRDRYEEGMKGKLKYRDLLNPDISADAMLRAQGLPPLFDPDDTTQTCYTLREAFPSWMFLPVDMDSTLMDKARSVTNTIAGNPLHLDGKPIGDGGSGDYIDLSRRGMDYSGKGEVARQAESGYVAVAVPVWLSENKFLEAMKDLHRRVIKKLGRMNDTRGAVPGLQALNKIERLYPAPKKDGMSHEEYVDKIEETTALWDEIILRQIPGPNDAAKRRTFMTTICKCRLEKSWLRRFSTQHNRKARDLRMSSAYRDGLLTEKDVESSVLDPEGTRGTRRIIAIHEGHP